MIRLANKNLRANASMRGLADYARHVATVAESEQRRFFATLDEAKYNSEAEAWAKDRLWTTGPYLDELRKIADHLERLSAK